MCQRKGFHAGPAGNGKNVPVFGRHPVDAFIQPADDLRLRNGIFIAQQRIARGGGKGDTLNGGIGFSGKFRKQGIQGVKVGFRIYFHKLFLRAQQGDGALA